MFGLSRFVVIGAVLAVITAQAAFIFWSVRENKVLEIRAETAEAANAKIVADLEANSAAVRALSERYREVYAGYAEARDKLRKRNTAALLIAEPTQASQQIKNEINEIFKQIEGGM